jgi:hypothetical protein
MDSSLLNLQDFETSFISISGADLGYVGSYSVIIPNLDGPLLALGILYNYSILAMLADDGLPQNAGKVKQQYFGEVLVSSFSLLAQNRSTIAVPVMKTEVVSRLVVVYGFGYTIGTLLFLLAVAAIGIFWLTNLKRRPLQLEHDPNTMIAAAFMLEGTDAAASFANLDRQPAYQIKMALKDTVYNMNAGKLSQAGPGPVAVANGMSNSITNSKRRQILRNLGITEAKHLDEDWRPWSLRLWGILLFMISLLILAVGVVLVIQLSNRSRLYSHGLVVQDTISVRGHYLTTLAPSSIIPTLFATLVKLWFTTFDDSFRRLTPFLAIFQNPRKPSNGAALSYITTPLLWVTAVAATKGHWFLALITLGALFAEILQITMSALWTNDFGSLRQSIILNRNLQIRTTSHVLYDQLDVSSGGGGAVPSFGVQGVIYGQTKFFASWIFTALNQITYNGISPGWSMEDWSFPPVEFAQVANSNPMARLASQTSNETTFSLLNVTFNSPALSSRLECSSITNSSKLLTYHTDLQSPFNWNTTLNPSGITAGYEIQQAAVNSFGFTEPSNGVTPDKVSIGQWSDTERSLGYQNNPLNGSQANFTIFWTYADYPQTFIDSGGQTKYIFETEPQIQALNCLPVFEKANARITVGAKDSRVVHYTLLDSPQNATEAWDDTFTRYWQEDVCCQWNDTVR